MIEEVSPDKKKEMMDIKTYEKLSNVGNPIASEKNMQNFLKILKDEIASNQVDYTKERRQALINNDFE